jgi:tetratricopeptide (TPR) repeat protein
MRLTGYLIVLCCLLPMLSMGKEDPKRKQEELLKKIRTSKSDAAKIQLYEDLYDVYMDFDRKRAYQCLDEMYKLAAQAHSKKGMAKSEGLKGLYFHTIQKADSALVHFRRQLRFLAPEQHVKRAKTYCNIGLMFNTMNKADSALVYFNRSLKICRKTDCGNTYCAVLNNLGMTVYTLGNPKKSEAYFKEAYSCALEQKDTTDLPRIMNNLIVANISTGKGNPEKLFRELLQKSRYPVSNDLKGTVYMNLGSYYFRNEQWTLAKKYFLLSDSIFRKTGQRNPEIVHCLGNIHQQQRQYSDALHYFKAVRNQFPHYNQSGKLYSDIARTYTSQNQLDSAAFYYELGLTATDSLKMQTVSAALEQTQNNLEFLRKETEIRELTLQQKIRESNEQRVRLIGIGIIAGLILLVVIAVLYFRKERGKRKLNEALVERKNERIREFGDKVESRNKAIAEIEKKFAEYRDKQDMQEQLKEDVIDSLFLDGDKEVFGYYFEDQHKGFYEALKKHAPSLTNNDLRLCSLTRMRLSLKETAEILNLSVDAVKSGRYRVRKKLNLEADENLSDFLNQLT